MQPGPTDEGNETAAVSAPVRGAWDAACPDPGFDPSVAHPARVYAYWLGGKDHHLADRVAAEEVKSHRPQVAVLHFIADSDDPAAIVATLARQLAPGSYLAISHLTADFAPGPVGAAAGAYTALVPTPLIPRNHTQVSALFGGLPLVPPGVVPIAEWRSATAGPFPHAADLYASVACIPGGRT